MLQSIKISELPSAETLSDDDLVIVDQPDNTKKATLFQVLGQISDSVEGSVLDVLAQPTGAGKSNTTEGLTVQQVIDRDKLNLREQWQRQMVDSGLNLVDGSFEEGATVSSNNDVVWFMAGGLCYSWGGELPKDVPVNSTPSSSGGIGEGFWSPVMKSLRQNLGSGTGTDLIGFQEVKLTDELKKTSGLQSLGYAPIFPMGYDTTALGSLYTFKGQDITHFFRGSIHAGKNLFGIRNNACVTSFRAGNGSEDQGMWNSQVTGVSNNLRLAQYGSPDKVGAYGDIAGTIQKAYQAPLPAVSFTANGFYTANTDVLNNAKVGMIMYTDESPRKWNIIASIDKSTGLITGWDNWADSSAYGTPATGSRVTVDPEGKLWTLNYNLIFPSGGRANQGVIAELGLLNQNGNSSNVNGIDLVNLPQSTSDGDTALLIRGGGYSGSKGWLTGASIRGYKNYGLWFVYTPEYVAASDMRFSTASNVGIQFTGGHATYSMTFALGGGGAFKDYLQTALDPKGFTVRSGRISAVITGTASLSGNIKCYRLNISSASTITLPNTDGLSAGHCQELLMYKNTAITIQSFNGTTLVSIGAGGSYASQSWTPTAGKRYILDWDGSSWKIWE